MIIYIIGFVERKSYKKHLKNQLCDVRQDPVKYILLLFTRITDFWAELNSEEFNIALDTVQVIMETILPADHLTGAKHSAFSTNHMTDIDKTKHNCNQEHTKI